MVDVVRFGGRYCSQRPEVNDLLGEIVNAHQSRPYRTRAALLSAITRGLREAGLVVATPVRRAPEGGPCSRKDLRA